MNAYVLLITVLSPTARRTINTLYILVQGARWLNQCPDLERSLLKSKSFSSHQCLPSDYESNTLVPSCDALIDGNVGCGILEKSTVSFGEAFNKNGGGVYATLFTTDGISIWFFPVCSFR